MILTDTHTHLYSEEFNEDRNLAIDRAIQEGVERFFIPAIDSVTVPAMYELEQRYPDKMFLMAGLHPTHVKENVDDELNFVEKQLESRNFCAIGEIGMDLYWDTSFKEEQQRAFQQQIKWAKAYELPIAIHCRNAFDEVFEVLERESDDKLKGVFHCFTGTLEQAHQALSYNMKLGIGGVATFKNGKIDQFLDKIDINHILLETDAPYLAPVPYRGRRNESSYLPLIAQKVAEIYNVSIEEVAQKTTNNSKELFGI